MGGTFSVVNKATLSAEPVDVSNAIVSLADNCAVVESPVGPSELSAEVSTGVGDGEGAVAVRRAEVSCEPSAELGNSSVGRVEVFGSVVEIGGELAEVVGVTMSPGTVVEGAGATTFTGGNWFVVETEVEDGEVGNGAVVEVEKEVKDEDEDEDEEEEDSEDEVSASAA